MTSPLEQYLALKEQVEELEPDHWLAHIEEEVNSDLSELLGTGSVTITTGGREYVLSIRVQEALPPLKLAAVWNTGRLYTREGQIIAAVAEPTKVNEYGERVYSITFRDASRHITGRFETIEPEIVSWGLKRIVGDVYDLGDWKDVRPEAELEEKLNKMVREFPSTTEIKGIEV